MTIVNLRGTNGSGKSTVARALLSWGPHTGIDLAPYTTPKGAPRVVKGYHVLEHDLIVVGPYTTDCGGCDAIKTQALVKQSIKIAASQARHVFFEGVIVSTLFSGYLELAQQLRTEGLSRAGRDFIWAYLDTPLNECLARIQKRNGGKPIKEALVADKVKAIRSTIEKAIAAGEQAVSIDHTNAVEKVKELFI